MHSFADRHGIADDRLADCARWLFLGIKRGELRWPYVMASLDAAKTCAHVAGLDMTSYALFATALWTGHVDAYVSETATPGVSQTLTEGNPPAPGGTLLGWDVLGTEYGGHLDHSWLCGSIQDEVAEDLGIVPNDLGLLNTLAEAAAVVRWIDDGDGMRGEPASWFPWQVLRYQSL